MGIEAVRGVGGRGRRLVENGVRSELDAIDGVRRARASGGTGSGKSVQRARKASGATSV